MPRKCMKMSLSLPLMIYTRKRPFTFLLFQKNTLNQIEQQDEELIGELFLAAKHIAKEQGVEGYKLAINVGRKGGQEVDHLHIHLLAEKE